MARYAVSMLVEVEAPDEETARDAAEELHVSLALAGSRVTSYQVTEGPREVDR